MSKTIALVLFALAASLTIFGLYSNKSFENPKSEIPQDVLDLYSVWKIQFNKTLLSAEENNVKLGVFYENYKKIISHNEDTNRTYDLGLNEFMDLTHEQFANFYLTADIPSDFNLSVKHLSIEALKDSVDWTKVGAVTAVKNQGQCGSCWAFSTTGALESAEILAGKKSMSLSEQQLVDCSYGNNGCKGGWTSTAFQYIQDHGLESNSQYPYVAKTRACKSNGGRHKISGFVSVSANDVNQLAAAVNLKPVSICLDANNFQLYSGGIFNNCGNSIDHCVLLVGYTPNYWIVKNSWGGSWGERGYIRLARGNTCGLASHGTYPNVI